MAVDTTIQFNGHNSYKVTELLLAYPFGVQGMTYITHSFQVYCNSPLASATRAKTKFFDADGATLSEVSHAFAVPAVFEKVSITVPVPATAVQAQLVFLHGGTDWWFAEPKSEEGQTATPYNVNYAGQLTYITPNGVYTGMVTANQIVVTGSIAQPDETLETRLVTINNNAINLSATVSGQGSRLTTVEAGQITLSSRVGAVEPKVTKITSAGVYTGEVVATQITSGLLKSSNNSSWINLDDGKFSFGNSALTWNGSTLSASGSFTSTNGSQSVASENGGITLRNGTTDLGYFSIASSGATGPYVTASQAATTITLGKVVSSSIYHAYRIQYSSSFATLPKHVFYGDIEAGGKATIYGDIEAGGKATISGVISTSQIWDTTDKPRVYFDSTQTLLYDGDSKIRMKLATDKTISIFGGGFGQATIVSAAGQTYLRNPGTTDHAIGVDATGPYYVKSGAKTYF